MAVPNGVRGEFPITLEGAEYVLRPDYEAVAAIDEQLGSIVDVARRLNAEGSISLREISVIICEGLKAHGRKTGYEPAKLYTARRVGEMVYATGVHRTLAPVAQFVLAALNGGSINVGNDEAPPTETTTES